VFEGPSTRTAADLLGTWGKDFPLLVVADDEQENVIKSFRNLPGVYVVSSVETEVAELVWARSVLATESALSSLEGRAK
jgi:ribosomal protein L4